MCFERTAFGAMSLEWTALRAMSSLRTLFLPGSAVAVPARATHNAIKATIIDGDGRLRTKKFIALSFFVRESGG
jgi:hypothetical protein